MNNYFEGWYLKHQKGDDTIAFIPGISDNSAFIQVITNDNAHNVLYPLSEYRGHVRIGDNVFSKNGVKIDLRDKGVDISGEITYAGLTPVKYDIMGIFKYFPMECRHGIISMRHGLDGSIDIDGKRVDFTNGLGYIEKDSGTAFPKTYMWIHCNDFKENCSVMASVADIPFLGLDFKGCICVICYRGREYRLATYLGVKIDCCDAKRLALSQGKYRLEIDIGENDGQELYAPSKGKMTRVIRERIACNARFRFFIKGRLIFDLESDNASFEYV